MGVTGLGSTGEVLKGPKPKKEPDRLPTTSFQVRTVSFRDCLFQVQLSHSYIGRKIHEKSFSLT